MAKWLPQLKVVEPPKASEAFRRAQAKLADSERFHTTAARIKFGEGVRSEVWIWICEGFSKSPKMARFFFEAIFLVALLATKGVRHVEKHFRGDSPRSRKDMGEYELSPMSAGNKWFLVHSHAMETTKLHGPLSCAGSLPFAAFVASATAAKGHRLRGRGTEGQLRTDPAHISTRSGYPAC